MIDAVLSYHLNPNTCGVAKFNHELARRLRVPIVALEDWIRTARAHWNVSARPFRPLVSIKWGELAEWDDEYGRFDRYRAAWLPPYDLLLHDREMKQTNAGIKRAARVFYADELGCPSTLTGNATRGAYRVLVFGMAHKILAPHFERLKTELDAKHPDYTVELSTAVHEGSPWDDALSEAAASMRRIFGDKLRVLGFLADDAIAKELREVDAVALYYDPALRANNTTAFAALAAGKTLYTNRDDLSPTEAPTWEKVIAAINA